MKKIFCIGECSLDIILNPDGSPVGAMPGGRIVNAAEILARRGLPVTFLGEAASDAVGDIVASHLTAAGVDTSALDRITEGRTPVMVYVPGADGAMTVTRYEDYPEECFDVVWPRIEAGDIVVFGGHYAIDPRMRRRLGQLLHHCSEIKAILLYLPGFLPQQEPRITRVMPSILENLELADVVLTRNRDLEMLFGTKTGDQCYTNHIDFYCRSLINIDQNCHQIDYFSGKEVTTAAIPEASAASMVWNAGAVAGTVEAICKADLDKQAFETPADPLRRDILSLAVTTANAALAALEADWQKKH